ncbi:MAG: hypothetical protein U5K71_16560 [Gracilimonas sp.]|nr:hypothetical protein [Gracilimonas sp.]
MFENSSSKPIPDIRLKIVEDPYDKRIYIHRTRDLFEHEETYKAKVEDRREEADRVVELSNEGKSYREIEELTGISKSKVGNMD